MPTLQSARFLITPTQFPTAGKTKIDVLTDNIERSNPENRIFLKNSLEIRLVSLQEMPPLLAMTLTSFCARSC
jgi:hypothetical protein